MLAGCSSTLLSPRHRLRSDSSSLAFQPCHLQVQEKLHQHQHTSQQKMGTQRLDMSCGFARKDAPRISISVDNAMERRSSLSFRQNPTTPTSLSASLVSPPTVVPWEAKSEVVEGVVQWEKGAKGLKRLYVDDDECGDVWAGKSKRIRGSDSGSSCNRLPPAETAAAGKQEKEEEEVSKGIEQKDAAIGSTSEQYEEQQHQQPPPQGRTTRSGSSSTPDTPHCSSFRRRRRSPNDDGDDEYSENGAAAASARTTRRRENNEEARKTERQGLELMNSLVACLESVGAGNYVATNYFLSRLGQLASPEGTAIHRVVAYFTEALALRVGRLWPHTFRVIPPPKLLQLADDEGDATALRLLNHVSPIPSFLHFTLNEMLLRAFEDKDRVHIIDFDIKQGLQWPGLLQSLASRPNPPSHLRITGVGDSRQELQDTGTRLAGFARALNLPFDFHPVIDRFEDVRFWMLHVKEGEHVAVNCVLQLHKALYDGTGDVLMDFLGLVRSTNPTIILVAEQEAEHDDPRWEARLTSALPYYSAIFDAVDEGSRLAADSPARIRIEEMYAREIRNIVACEGSERVERHRGFSTWRGLMEDRAGFRCVEVGEREVMQGRILLRMFGGGEEDGGDDGGFDVAVQGDDKAGLTLTWRDQPLYTVSAWAPPS